MKCQYCNAEIAEDSVFCTSCGKKQEKKAETKMIQPLFCTSCGAKLKEGAVFCTSCGTKVNTVSDIKKEPDIQ